MLTKGDKQRLWWNFHSKIWALNEKLYSKFFIFLRETRFNPCFCVIDAQSSRCFPKECSKVFVSKILVSRKKLRSNFMNDRFQTWNSEFHWIKNCDPREEITNQKNLINGRCWTNQRTFIFCVDKLLWKEKRKFCITKTLGI